MTSVGSALHLEASRSRSETSGILFFHLVRTRWSSSCEFVGLLKGPPARARQLSVVVYVFWLCYEYSANKSCSFFDTALTFTLILRAFSTTGALESAWVVRTDSGLRHPVQIAMKV